MADNDEDPNGFGVMLVSLAGVWALAIGVYFAARACA